MPPPDFLCEKVGIEVSDKEHCLIEHETGEPHMRCAAEIRGQQPAHKRFHPEKKEGSEKHHAGKYHYRQSVTDGIRC